MVPWTMAPSDGQHGAGSGGPGHAQKSKGASSSHALSASAQSDPGPSNPYWSEAWSSPYTTEWPTGPICVNGKQLIAYNSSEKRSVTYGAFDFGGEHTFEVQHVKAPWPSTPRGDLIISWFSCEGNVHHMLGETIYPLWKTLSQGNLSALRQKQIERWTRVAFVNTPQWPPREDGDCHSGRFASLLALLPLHEDLLLGPGAAARLEAGGALRARPSPPAQCFARARQQLSDAKGAAGLPQSFYRWIADEAGGCHPPSTEGGAQVLLVRRATTRRIVNERKVEAMLRGLPQVARLQVIDFANMTAFEQMRAVCGAHVMVGVHGQGNEWGHFLNGARGGGGGLLELRYDGWPCYYAPRMEMGDSQVMGICQEHGRYGPSEDPKFADVKADLALLKEGATAILQRALSWPEAKPATSHGADAGAAKGPLPVKPKAKAVAVGEAGTAKMAGAIGSRITIDEPPQPQAQAQTRLASRPPSKRSKGPKLTSSMPPDQHL